MPMRSSPCMVKGGAPTVGWTPVRLYNNSGSLPIYFGPPGVKACFRAQVPVEVLQHCCTSRDYIYWLEAVAQLISIAAVARDQFDCLICFVDNTAAEHALNKGTSKNAALCWLLGSFWLWAAKRGLFVTFQRVTSQANLSDKVSRGDFSEAEQLHCETWEPAFDRAWPDLLRLQQAPESTSSWDYQAVIDSLFEITPHSEGGEGAR